MRCEPETAPTSQLQATVQTPIEVNKGEKRFGENVATTKVLLSMIGKRRSLFVPNGRFYTSHTNRMERRACMHACKATRERKQKSRSHGILILGELPPGENASGSNG